MQRHLLCKLCKLLIIHVVVVTESQTIQENDPYTSTGASGRHGNAFHALRSCHQVLYGDTGEFFSPDYLCSSPALWCNWTVQVHPGKRVQLYLEDLTPPHACHLKTDQIHLDESPVTVGESRILERCWGTARYTSVTNTVHVVQLIGPNPNPPQRGFYGQFRAFGPPETPATASTVSRTNVTDVLPEEEEDDVVDDDDDDDDDDEEAMGPVERVAVSSHENIAGVTPLPVHRSSANPAEVRHDVDPWSSEFATITAGPWEKNSGEIRRTRGGAENRNGASRSTSHHSDSAFVESVVGTTTEEPGQFSPRRTPNVSHTPPPTRATHAVGKSARKMRPVATSISTTRAPTTEEISPIITRPSPVSTRAHETEATHAAYETGPAKMDVNDALPVEMMLASNGATLRTGAEESNGSYRETEASSAKPNPSPILKGNSLLVQSIRNPDPPHLPGGVLLEVRVEVGLDHAENWDEAMSSFRDAVETMVQAELESFNLRTVSLKRSIKLSAGALFVVWVQLGEGSEVNHTLGVPPLTLQGLRGRSLSPPGARSRGSVISVSVEDIDECKTQLIVCDVHADCVNEFGSYSCHCHHGYSPGLGGAVCEDAAERDCLGTPVPTLLYAICFLLCFLVVLLLVVLLVLYRRHHRGAFLPRCLHGSVCSGTSTANDANNNSSSGLRGGRKRCGGPSSGPPPPPPPLRLSRGACPAPDLPLLKFSSLAPPDGYETKLQSERCQL